MRQPYRPYRVMPHSNVKQYVGLVSSMLIACAAGKDLFGGVYADWFALAGLLGTAAFGWSVRRD
jgi:hypothetical protein